MNKLFQLHVALGLAVAALALGSCGGKSGSPPDAGGVPDSSGGPDTGADGVVMGTMTCDPGVQNCAAGQKCDFNCQGGETATVSCVADGTGALGATCSFSMPCARGNGCLTMPTGGGSMCRKYCASDTDCATGERCHNDTVFVRCTGPETSFLLHFCY
jgi:hypothetical protein